MATCPAHTDDARHSTRAAAAPRDTRARTVRRSEAAAGPGPDPPSAAGRVKRPPPASGSRRSKLAEVSALLPSLSVTSSRTVFGPAVGNVYVIGEVAPSS